MVNYQDQAWRLATKLEPQRLAGPTTTGFSLAKSLADSKGQYLIGHLQRCSGACPADVQKSPRFPSKSSNHRRIANLALFSCALSHSRADGARIRAFEEA